MAIGAPVVLLGLLSALCWGAGDFGGGIAGRRAPLFGIVMATQAIGMVVALGLFLVSGERVPAALDVAWSAVAAVLGAIGITALYGGLARGRMSVVAPVTGVLAATVPVVAGIALQGPPAASVALGIGAALLAVVLVSRVSDEAAGPSGIRYALVAGAGIGLFNVAIAQVSDGIVFGPLAIMRGVQALVLVAAILATRSAWRVHSSVVPLVVLVGFLDMGGNAFYIAATQAGDLAVAATLSSLYPVTTVILAGLLLRERIAPAHGAGIGLAGVAIVLIASGAG